MPLQSTMVGLGGISPFASSRGKHQLFFGWTKAPVHQKEPTKNKDVTYEPVVGQENTPIQISAKMAMDTRKLNATKRPAEFMPRASKVMSFSDKPQTMPVNAERPRKTHVASIKLSCKNHVSTAARKLPRNMRCTVAKESPIYPPKSQ